MRVPKISLWRLIFALVIFIPMSLITKLDIEWAMLCGCILLAGFIAASED